MSKHAVLVGIALVLVIYLYEHNHNAVLAADGCGITTTKPCLNLAFSGQIDPNSLPISPRWEYQVANQDLPDTAAVCNGFKVDPSGGKQFVKLDPVKCTSDIKGDSIDYPTSWINKPICSLGGSSDSLHGHLNWGRAAYFAGRLYAMDDIQPFHDSDYNFAIETDTDALVTSTNWQHFGLGQAFHAVGVEFDSSETLPHTSSQWWSDFEQQSYDGNAGKVVHGNPAVLIGEVGLDLEHEAHSEVHPVYAIAIDLGDKQGVDTWAIMVRNWGDEGFCSSEIHQLKTPTVSLWIPKPGVTGGQVISTDIHASPSDVAYEIRAAKDGAQLTVKLGAFQPPPHWYSSGRTPMIEGTFQIQWTPKPAALFKSMTIQPGHPRISGKEGEDRLAGLMSSLSLAERQRLRKSDPIRRFFTTHKSTTKAPPKPLGTKFALSSVPEIALQPDLAGTERKIIRVSLLCTTSAGRELFGGDVCTRAGQEALKLLPSAK
jgi:hypothetical protein